MEAIAEKYLGQLCDRLKETGVQLQLQPGLAAKLMPMEKGKEGARQIRRQVQQLVADPLASYLLGWEMPPKTVCGAWVEGKMQFESLG